MLQSGFAVHPVQRLVSDEQVSLFAGFAVSNISDAMGRTIGSTGLRAFHNGAPMAGRAITVRTVPGDNLMIHKAIDMASAGDVIVVDAGGLGYNATIGELMTTYARLRGVAGFVVDGAVRDTAELARSDLPVYARGVSPRGPTRLGPGEINVTVCVDGVVVHPGDLVLGDADGVIAIRPHEIDALAHEVRAIEDKERTLLSQMSRGEVDRAWVDETLNRLGCDMSRI